MNLRRLSREKRVTSTPALVLSKKNTFFLFTLVSSDKLPPFLLSARSKTHPLMKANIFGSFFLLVFLGILGAIIWNGISSASKPGNGDEVVLMDFYATWCGPCMRMKPVVRELAAELSGQLRVMELKTSENRDLAEQYNVSHIPCFVVLRDGKEVARKTGYMSKEDLRSLTGL